MKSETRLGMVVLAVFLVANQLLKMPHFLLGLLIGVAICFIILGNLPKKQYNVINTFKQKIYKKLFNKNNKQHSSSN
jgi:Na+-transporting NADH:ubiquinone oxidoreductase subunit NqrB